MRAPRGTTLIEAMMALSILLFGFTGFAALQISTVKSNHFAKRLAQASAIAMDLGENVSLWAYSDTRLNSATTVPALTDSAITSRWDMGRNATSSFTADYSEQATDTNATTAGGLGATYLGLSGDVDGDGKAEYIRYWNVTAVDLLGTGVPNGKFIQIIVRWYEPGLGYRQITSSTFKPNPAFAIR